ncbi:hypothetical protein GE09DRAFT_1269843 [Coniochaeta sp. 2T2.1]|nr:hypothetical protein GE09DRAFT_1269843 [Coniochaeta sp. 2T2.1]
MTSILICDYYLVRRGNVSVPDMYNFHGIYRYSPKLATNWRAVVAFFIGCIPPLPGFVDNIVAGRFNAPSAYSCVSRASIYCHETSACAPAAIATPIIPPFDNPSFESGILGSWTEVPPATPGNLVGSVSTEQAHSGQVRFEPGGRYEFSFWYYSVSNQSRGTLSLKVEYPGTNIPLVIQMTSQGTGRWIQQRFTLTPTTSFGTFSVTYAATKGTVGNTIYIDDVTFTKTA